MKLNDFLLDKKMLLHVNLHVRCIFDGKKISIFIPVQPHKIASTKNHCCLHRHLPLSHRTLVGAFQASQGKDGSEEQFAPKRQR